MAKNFVFEGDHIPYTASGAVSSGAGVAIGTLLGVSLTDVAAGATGEAAVEGVWELPKASAENITAGASLIWDVSAGEFVITSPVPAVGDLIGAATAIAAAGVGTTTVRARLNPGNATVSA